MFLLRDDISSIAATILQSGVICYPTDTVWGLGCDPLDEAAVQRIGILTQRPEGEGYILLADSIEMLRDYVPQILPRIETLLAYHLRPITLIYAESVGLPAWVKAKDGSVAIRVAQDPFCRELIRAIGRPLVSACACKKGEQIPPTFGSISSEILGAVDYVVKHRQDDKTIHSPSSIATLDAYKELDFIRE